MLILPKITTPDITAKPELKSLFSGPLENFFPDLVILTFQLGFFLLKNYPQVLIYCKI